MTWDRVVDYGGTHATGKIPHPCFVVVVVVIVVAIFCPAFFLVSWSPHTGYHLLKNECAPVAVCDVASRYAAKFICSQIDLTDVSSRDLSRKQSRTDFGG